MSLFLNSCLEIVPGLVTSGLWKIAEPCTTAASGCVIPRHGVGLGQAGHLDSWDSQSSGRPGASEEKFCHALVWAGLRMFVEGRSGVRRADVFTECFCYSGALSRTSP